MTFSETSIFNRQWRIQDFPEEGALTPKGGRQPIIWPIFAKNCMKMKKFWAGGARVPRAPPLDPPLVVHQIFWRNETVLLYNGSNIQMWKFCDLIPPSPAVKQGIRPFPTYKAKEICLYINYALSQRIQVGKNLHSLWKKHFPLSSQINTSILFVH